MNRKTYRKIGTCVWIVLVTVAVSACNDTKPMASDAPTVVYRAVEGSDVTLTRELPGRVSAFQVSEVRPQVGGIITKRLFEEGSDVTAGQVLYEIDPALYEAAFKNARAALARADANLVSTRLLAQRYGKLVKTNSISKQEHDDAVAAYKQSAADVEAARESLETAQINLGYTKVTAPVSGRIGRSFVTVGALATQNQVDPLATVQQLSPVYVDVTQSSTDLLKLRRDVESGLLRSSADGSARITLKLEDGTPYATNAATAGDDDIDWVEGNLLFSDVTIEQSTGVVSLRAIFENPRKVLLPGMYVRAVLEEGVRENAVLVPQKSVMRDTRGRPMVYVLTKTPPRNGTAEPVILESDAYSIETRSVTIDRSFGNNWLLSQGVEVGELLLLEGHQKVRPGQIALGRVSAPEATALAQKGQQSATVTR